MIRQLLSTLGHRFFSPQLPRRKKQKTITTRPTIESLEGRIVPATFDFGGFSWDDTDSPNLLDTLNPGVVPDGDGAVITNIPVNDTGIVNFPNPPVAGFLDNLAIGNLFFGTAQSAGGDESRALNMPGGNNGTANRSGIQLSWSGGRALPNVAGNDFVVYESASNGNTPEGFMVQVHSASTNTWSRWRYEPPDTFALYNPAQGAQGSFAHAFDFSSFGLAATESVDMVRIANLTDEDRMDDGSGTGFVIPEDNGATSSFFPDPGPLASFTMFGASTLDPDPLFFASLTTVENSIQIDPDLSITKTNGTTKVIAGKQITYTITAANNSTITVNGAAIADTFPAALESVSYTSTATGGATGNTAAGNGDINDVVDLPAGSTITYIVTATLDINATGTLANTATITPPGGVTDPILSNNTVTDTDAVTPATRLLAAGSGPGQSPLVHAYDVNGQLIRRFNAYDAAFTGGVRVATGDVNGDGFEDIITGAGPGGSPHVKVFDGRTSQVIHSFFAYDAAFSGGVFVGSGDVNNDGFDDIITGAGAGGAPHVKVFDAQSGAAVQNFYAYNQDFSGGVTVAGGDLNNDGFDDVITGAGPGAGPHVRAFDSTNMNLLADMFVYAESFTGGVFVSAGDTNNDGFADIITGAGSGGPHVRVFDGSNPSSPLQSFFAFEPTFTGGARVASLDRTGDGRDDIAAGRGPSTSAGPQVRSFDSANWNQIDSFFAFDQSFDGGVFVG